MNAGKEGDILIIDDVSEDDPTFGAIFIWGKMKYEAGPHVYRELRETKLKLIK